MPERRSLRTRAFLNSSSYQPPVTPAMSRPRRTVSGSTNQSITVARATSQSPDDAKKSIRLTVKMPSSKLREATSGSRKSIAVNSRDTFEGGEILNGPRGSRAKRSIVVESESEEENEEDEEEERLQSTDEQQDEEEEEHDEQEEDDGEEDEEAEDDSADDDVDAEGDIDMEDGSLLPAPPILKMTGPQKPSLTLTPAQESKAKGVEAKMELADDDDEELSELGSEGEEEADDAEGEETGGADEMDQDDESRSLQAESRASTPDVSKMTKRQRSRLDQVMGGDFLQLPMGMLTYSSFLHFILIS